MQDVTPDRGRIIDVASDSGSGVAGSTAAQSQPSDSSGADCQTKCSRYVAARPWIALAYALSTLLIAPAIVYSLLPIPLLRFCYFAVSGCFSIAAGWVMFETITALLSTLYMAGCVHMALDVDPKRKWPTFGYVIPAFLDNEAPILDETLEQYTRLDYPGKVIVQVVYNTKRPMELQEKVLIGSWDGRQVGRVHFSIIPNLNSSSKAENVNEGIARAPADVEFIAIMDADHHPAEDHAHKAVAIMDIHHYDVLQGACSIRMEGPLSWIIAAEFEDMYNVGHRGRTSLFGVGVFGGSNGCWRRSLLERIGMDANMLTEDIDASLRATRRGAKIGFSSFLRSSEEAPHTERTLRKQRLRWAQGWTEVSLKHLIPILLGRRTSMRQKFGAFLLLGWREVFVYVTVHPILLLLTYVSRDHNVAVELLFIVGGGAIVSVGMFRVLAAFLLARGQVRGNIFCFGLYFFLQLLWTMYMNIIQVIAHGQMLMGQNAWVATVRKSANGEMPLPMKGPVPQVEVDLDAGSRDLPASPRSLPGQPSLPPQRPGLLDDVSAEIVDVISPRDLDLEPALSRAESVPSGNPAEGPQPSSGDDLFMTSNALFGNPVSQELDDIEKTVPHTLLDDPTDEPAEANDAATEPRGRGEIRSASASNRGSGDERSPAEVSSASSGKRSGHIRSATTSDQVTEDGSVAGLGPSKMRPVRLGTAQSPSSSGSGGGTKLATPTTARAPRRKRSAL